MYSLPISFYSDYWRATKIWSSYLGGLAVFVAGTRYSFLYALDIGHIKQPIFLQTIQSFDINVAFQGEASPGVESHGAPNGMEKKFEVDGQILDQQVQAASDVKSPKQEAILQNSKPVPKKKVIIQNSIPAAEENLELAKINSSLTLKVESTAYTYTGNKTATGIEPREGLIAVDPKVIAMGSKVYVEGYGYAIAADTGGTIRGNKIDVFFPTLRQCIEWGRRPVHIYVIKSI